MTKWEKKVVDFIYNERITIMIFLITALGLIFRYSMIEFSSLDYKNYLVEWIEEINAYGGISSLKETIGNYSPPYVFILTIFTYIPIDNLVLIKMLSIFCDIILAASAGLVVYNILEKDSRKAIISGLATYSVVLLSPLVALNSAFWGQCESIYAMLCVLCILYLIKERYFVSFIFYGLAFAFKLQAVFLLPGLLIYYFFSKKFSLKYFLLMPVMYFVTSLPAIFAGRSIVEIAKIYFEQAGQYGSEIVMNYHNFTLLFREGDVSLLSSIMVIFAFCVLACGCMILLFAKFKPSFLDLIGAGVWGAWTCVMFLPHMHDRYGYLVEVLIIIYAILKPKYWHYAVGVNMIGLLSYIAYLTTYRPMDEGLVSIIHLLIFIAFSVQHIRYVFTKKNETNATQISTADEKSYKGETDVKSTC